MRLLNVKTLKFEEFIGEFGDGIPPYAILSHTWGDDEVSYSDYINQQSQPKKGHEKILRCCQVAESESFEYVWIDTCCIDKSSSAELSEAINSMFQWYQGAGICYAYLSDVKTSEDPTQEQSSFTRSRWFTRGWTLQELLAPGELVFLGSDWVEIGTKRSLCATVSSVTRISQKALEECRWSEYSVAQKMSWAAGRNTTRLEDEAYCLMGLFDVNMPLLYGEGRKAFLRLQQEILKQIDDASIFAWSYPMEMHSHTRISGLFALSPEYFKDASKIELLEPEHGTEDESPFQVVNRLIRLQQPMVDQVETIRLQLLPGAPPLYNIIEFKQSGETSKDHMFVSERTSPPSQKPEATVESKTGWSIRGLRRQIIRGTPKITVESENTHTDPRLDSSGLSDEKPDRILENKLLDDDLSLTEIEAQKILRTHAGGESEGALSSTSLESEGLVTLEKHYIYEPAIIVQLRCHIGHRHLGIILSKSLISKDGNVLWRLHYPSIVAMQIVPGIPFPPLMTVYANIFTKNMDIVKNHSNSWPEIRVASLIAAGYDVHQDCGPGWEFDRSRLALVQKKSSVESTWTKSVPLALFYRISGEELTSPTRAFFMSLTEYEQNKEGTSNLECEVGVIVNASLRASSFKPSDYEFYSFNLAKNRRVEVSLGNGQALVLKYREGSGIRFVNVSSETLNKAKVAVPEPHDITNTLRLRSKVFPMLMSLG